MSKAALLVEQAVIGRSGDRIRVNCPVCLERKGSLDRRASLSVSLHSGWYHCFRCEVRGYLRGFHKDAQRHTQEQDAPSQQLLPDGFSLLGSGPGATAEATASARRYLADRGVPMGTVREAQIGFAYDHKQLPRVVVPVLGEGSALLGWVARALAPSVVPKYLNASGVWAAHTVYNCRALQQRTNTPVMVVEGVFDALPYWPDAVAMLGKGVKGSQLQVLLQSRRPLVVCYDGDAHEEGWALACQLQLYGARAAAVRLPAAVDPNTVDKHWLLDEVRKAGAEV